MFLNLYRKKQILVLFNFKILVSASVKDKSLNPLPEGGGAQPIMNDQETILVVHKFNTRGLAIKLSN